MPAQRFQAGCSPRWRLGAAGRLLAALLLALAASAVAVPPPSMPLPQQQQQQQPRAAARYASGWIIVKLKASASAAPTVAAAAMPAAAATPLTPSRHGLQFVQPLSVSLSSGSGSPAGRRLAAAAAHRTGSVPGIYRITDGAKVPAKVAQLSALPGGLVGPMRCNRVALAVGMWERKAVQCRPAQLLFLLLQTSPATWASKSGARLSCRLNCGSLTRPPCQPAFALPAPTRPINRWSVCARPHLGAGAAPSRQYN